MKNPRSCTDSPAHVAVMHRNNWCVVDRAITLPKTAFSKTKARKLSLHEIPNVYCMNCPASVRAGYVGRDYGYSCTCGWVIELGAMLPDWTDAGFEYSGVSAPGDPNHL